MTNVKQSVKRLLFSVMKPHSFTLQYETSVRNTFRLGFLKCPICKENYKIIKSKNCKLLSTPFSRHSLDRIQPLTIACVDPRAIPTSIDPIVEARRLKLEKILNELKIHEIPIQNELKRVLVAVRDRCLDAFANDDAYLGHDILVEHSINAPDAPPFESKPAGYAFFNCKILEKVHQNAQKNLKSSPKYIKDLYDLGSSERVFHIADCVRVCLNNF